MQMGCITGLDGRGDSGKDIALAVSPSTSPRPLWARTAVNKLVYPSPNMKISFPQRRDFALVSTVNQITHSSGFHSAADCQSPPDLDITGRV
ncbi:hypothetical protein RRG08_059226 [Elysia crispata]|uniref:Uncharacterized protein n=1 Tax=Elysia crispata TaxID=231223 RepID=A0AAE0ZEH6_9GAST|nr:hypothetical protein RRG08_059226 [Elysia crispata]